jgi:hypothetical protein
VLRRAIQGAARAGLFFLSCGKLVPLLHDESQALLVAQIKLRHGSGFGCLLVRCLNGPEVLPALSNNRDAPASQLGGGGLLFGRFYLGLSSSS